MKRRAAAPAATAVMCLCMFWSLSALWPSAAGALTSPPRLGARAAVLIEESTGQELYGLDSTAELPIASTTKLMTALLTLEHVRQLNTMFRQNDYAATAVDSQIGLQPGEQMSVHDLLIAMLVPSADDAAEDLAYNVGRGSLTRFVAMMNRKAAELGLTHTHYTTPIGLDTPGNYSSASDLVKLAGFLLAHYLFFARAVALPSAVLHTGRHPRVVANRNDLVARVPWVNGVKTGHTLDAGYVLVGSGKRGGMTLLSAVLGTTSASARDSNTLALLNYGFANFRLAAPIRAGEVLARAAVKYRSGVRASLIAAGGLSRIVPRSTVFTLQVQAPRQLAGPLRRGTVVGTVTVLADGRPIGSTHLVLARALPAVSSLTIAAQFLTRGSTLLALAVVLAVLAGVTALRRARAREETQAL